MLRLMWVPLILIIVAFTIGGGIIGWHLQIMWNDFKMSRLEAIFHWRQVREDKRHRRMYESKVQRH